MVRCGVIVITKSRNTRLSQSPGVVHFKVPYVLKVSRNFFQFV